jgi:hypothetical protein
MIKDVQKLQNTLETDVRNNQAEIEKEALNLYKKKKTDAVNYLTNYTNSTVKDGVAQWKKLGEYLLVKYIDGVIKKEENGVFKRNPYGKPAFPNRPGYPEDHYRRIIKETGNRYKVIQIN